MKRLFTKVVVFFCCALCFIAFAEYYLRSKGYPCELSNYFRSGFSHFDPEVGVIPVNCGYTYTNPAQEGYDNGYHATITRWRDGARASFASPRKPTKKKILLLGCSYTMGEGLEDYETYAWHLNELFHDRTFENHGMNGFSTYKCYLYEKYQISKHPKNYYDLVIYAAIEDHLKRNIAYSLMTFGYNMLTTLKGDHSEDQEDLIFQHPESQIWLYPTVYLKSDHTLGYNPTLLRWPGDESFAFITLLKHIYWYRHSLSVLETMKNGATKESIEIFRLLLDKMDEYASQHGAKFAMVCLEDENISSIRYITATKYPILHATNGLEGEPDDAKFHVGGNIGYHYNGYVNKNWAKHIREELLKAGL